MTPRRVVLDSRTRILRTRRNGSGVNNPGGESAGATVRVLGGDPVTLVTPSPRMAALLDSAVIITDTAAASSLARALTDRGMAHPDVTGASSSNGRSPHISSPRSLDQVAVVVPVKDDEDGVRELIEALAPELERGLRVLVVDDGSLHTVAALPSLPSLRSLPTVTVLRHDVAQGPAGARNAGTAEVIRGGAEVVVYLDADVIPRPGWLDPLLAHLDDPLVAAVAPRIVAAEPGRLWVRGYETARSALDMGPHPARVRPRTRVPYVPSAALAVRPDRLPPVPDGGGAGPFDARMHVAEDVDLCWRTAAAGGRVRYEPASRVAHRHRTGTVRLLTRRAFYGTGAAPLARRHGADVAPAVAAPWSLAVAAGVWSGTSLGMVIAAGAAGRAWWRTRALTGDGRAAADLVARGAGASVRQLPEAALRPYWPVTASVLLATVPSRGQAVRGLRRRVAVAAVAEGLWHWWSSREPGHLPVDEPLGHVVLHRLDDLAYGVGVWRSAIADRSTGALRPEIK